METNSLGAERPGARNVMIVVTAAVFVIITLWWFGIHPFDSSLDVNGKNIWSSSYVVLSILGTIFGIVASRYWGGYKSALGRALLAFSIGLALQSFGQIVYDYYTLAANIQAPYPSLGDIGYFGSVLTYIYGAFVLLRGMKFPIKSATRKFLAVGLPLVMLLFSYMIFLNGYQYTGHLLTTLLDFGYPLGQAIYVSIALLVVFMSRDNLGGLMKNPIRLLLAALIVQYICDFDFLYLANHNTWYAGGPGDYLYAVSYFLMTLALIRIGRVALQMDGGK